jgi:stage V sporulation protein K
MNPFLFGNNRIITRKGRCVMSDERERPQASIFPSSAWQPPVHQHGSYIDAERRRREEMNNKMRENYEHERKRSEEQNKQTRMYDEALKELKALDGMDTVQEKIMEALALSNIFKAREKHSLRNEQHALHMIFTGNAGTGKTTIARLVGKLFAGAGLLKKGNFTPTKTDLEHRNNPFGESSSPVPKGDVPFVECSNADITSAFWGQDEQNMKKKFDQANGGVLFIDEAYSLISRSSHKSGEKVSAVIVTEMENRRDNVCVIAAGYPKEMEEFAQYNTGLASRFATVINFPNYSVPQLLKIAHGMSQERDYKMSEDYKTKLAERLEKERLLYTFGNARTVRNIIEESIRKHAKRVFEKHGASPARDILITLEKEDMVDFNPVFTGKQIVDPYEKMIAEALASGLISGGKAKLPKKVINSNRGSHE